MSIRELICRCGAKTTLSSREAAWKAFNANPVGHLRALVEKTPPNLGTDRSTQLDIRVVVNNVQLGAIEILKIYSDAPEVARLSAFAVHLLPELTPHGADLTWALRRYLSEDHGVTQLIFPSVNATYDSFYGKLNATKGPATGPDVSRINQEWAW